MLHYGFTKEEIVAGSFLTSLSMYFPIGLTEQVNP